jgi:large subunit ribosomal protein L25
MTKTHAPTTTLTLDVRPRAGTTSARAVRRAGQIPGVLYGHGAPTPVAVGAKALEELLTHGGKSNILDATVGGAHDSVLLRDVQRDPVTHRPIHADFQRVTKGEAITATVAVLVTGTSAATRFRRTSPST